MILLSCGPLEALLCEGVIRYPVGHRRSQKVELLMKVAIAGDHAGFELRTLLVHELAESGYEVEDCGAYEWDATDDYPDIALSVAVAVQMRRVERGIIICGSGVGATIVANKVKGVRAATCHDTYSARQGVEHDDMNVLCLGARVVGIEVAREIVAVFMRSEFSGEERHVRRLAKIRNLETSESE